MARYPKITQNYNFAISLQYLKKELSNEVDFLHADKHASLLQIDTVKRVYNEHLEDEVSMVIIDRWSL